MFCTQLVQSLVLISLYIAVNVWLTFQRTGSRAEALASIHANCAISPASAYHDGPYNRGVDWCPDTQQAGALAVINHLRVHSAGADASFPAEFSSNLRAIYIPKLDLLMLNPRQVWGSEELWPCTDRLGRETVSLRRHRRISVVHLTESFLPAGTTELSEAHACLVQAILDVL